MTKQPLNVTGLSSHPMHATGGAPGATTSSHSHPTKHYARHAHISSWHCFKALGTKHRAVQAQEPQHNNHCEEFNSS
jgi:hypothetical protein